MTEKKLLKMNLFLSSMMIKVVRSPMSLVSFIGGITNDLNLGLV